MIGTSTVASLRNDITTRLHWLPKHFDPVNPQLEVDCNQVARQLVRTSDVPGMQRLLRRTIQLQRRVDAQALMRQLLKDRRELQGTTTMKSR